MIIEAVIFTQTNVIWFSLKLVAQRSSF